MLITLGAEVFTSTPEIKKELSRLIRLMQLIQQVPEMPSMADFWRHWPRIRDIWEAADFANALAALSVQKIGTTPSMPVRSEIDDF